MRTGSRIATLQAECLQVRSWELFALRIVLTDASVTKWRKDVAVGVSQRELAS